MIVVIPDGNSRYGCGQWVDSPVTGNFEQYVLHDVVPAAQDALFYRALAAFGLRVIDDELERRGLAPSPLSRHATRSSVENDSLECGAAASAATSHRR